MNTTASIIRSPLISPQIQDLPHDLKRILRMQWKEFVNFVDDAQLASSSMSISANDNSAQRSSVKSSTSAAA